MPASSPNGEALVADGAVGCGFRTSFDISTACAGGKTAGGFGTAGGAACPDADAAALAAIGAGACGATPGAPGAASAWATAPARSCFAASGSAARAPLWQTSPH